MKLLVLHRVPYAKIDYHRGIDHAAHDVTYIGTAKALANIPRELRCVRVERPGIDAVSSEVIGWARSLAGPAAQPFDRVISMSEYELLDAARVREALGVPGPHLDDVRKVRDKLLMKRLVVAAGLHAPQALPLEDVLQAVLPWSGKTVLKPIDGASSEDVVVFSSAAALASALRSRQTGVRRIDEQQQLAGFEVEEFVSGPILHFDGLVWNGEVRLMVGSRYVGTCLDYARGQPMGSVQFDADAVQQAWVQQAVRAVGIEQGAFHLEAIEDDSGVTPRLVFLEIANRVGGADVVDTFELATGIHMPSVELAMVTGLAPKVNPCAAGGLRFGWFVFPGHHLAAGGCRLEGHEAFRRHPGIHRWNELAAQADLPRSITYQAVEVPVSGVISAASHDEGAALLQRLFAEISVHSVPRQAAPAEAALAETAQ